MLRIGNGYFCHRAVFWQEIDPEGISAEIASSF
jgi:hypothetical protein